MSLDEARRELKDDEGDPMLRSQRKAMHESLLMQDMVQRVRRSKVLVVERM
jgi:type III secretion protein U